MTLLECPLCCAENFPDEASLKEHLLSLSENIVCPLCEVQFKTIRCLGLHLGGECANLQEEPTADKKVSNEHFDETTATRNESKILLEEVGVRVEQATVEQVITEPVSAPDVPKIQTTDDDFMEMGLGEDELATSDDIVTEGEPTTTGTLDEVNLFSCSVCDITFTSVEEHLNQFHRDEQVFIDSNSHTQSYQVLECRDEFVMDAVDEEKMDDGEIPSASENYSSIGEDILSDGSSIIWTQDIKTLMLGNWTMDDESTNGGQNSWGKVSNNQRGYVLMPRVDGSDEAQWVKTRQGYLYAPTEERAAQIRLRELAETPIQQQEHDWPPEIAHLPLATFVLPGLPPDHQSGCLIENKPYVYRDHKVRVVTVKGIEGIPELEEVPFPKCPVGDVRMWPPLLEPAPVGVDAPDDLTGSFAVLWQCRLCSQLDLDPTRHHVCLTRRGNESCKGTEEEVVKLLDPNRGKIECEICSAKVVSTTHLEKHMKMHRKNELIKCEICLGMVPKTTFDKHRAQHDKHGQLSLVCRSCNRPFKNEAQLELHEPQCHKPQEGEVELTCDICKLRFPQLEELRTHMADEHNIPVKLHPCQFCPKSYARLIDKVIHEGVHTRARPHECSVCSRCFRLKSSLLTHSRIHTGERPYICPVCGKGFRTKYLVQTHSATHGSDNPYKCSKCPKAFKGKEKAKMHEVVHRKAFTCEECGRHFHTWSFMRRHKENHRNGKLVFTCTLCPQMFARAGYLENHLIDEHGLDPATSIHISSLKTFEHMAKTKQKQISPSES